MLLRYCQPSRSEMRGDRPVTTSTDGGPLKPELAKLTLPTLCRFTRYIQTPQRMDLRGKLRVGWECPVSFRKSSAFCHRLRRTARQHIPEIAAFHLYQITDVMKKYNKSIWHSSRRVYIHTSKGSDIALETQITVENMYA
jgi:hypothetical protein